MTSRFSRSNSGTQTPIRIEEDVFEEEGSMSLKEDYYAILNVDKNATDVDIKNAYKRLCMTFHPDKHHENARQVAELKFHLIQKAYDSLIDPNKRHIYDLYGEDGLNESWDLTAPMDKDQIRKEFERRAKLKRELDEQNAVKSKGEINIAFDATRLFMPNRGAKREGLLGLLDIESIPEIQHALVVHSWENRINDSNSVTLRGNVVSKNGLGSGSIVASVRHIVSPLLWGEVAGTIGDNSGIDMKIVKNFSSDIFSTLNLSFKNLVNFPTASLMFGRKISTHTTGYITYRPDLNEFFELSNNSTSSCTIGFVHAHEKVESGLDIKAGLNSSYINVFQTRPFGAIRGRLQVTVATDTGLSFSIGGDRKLDKSTRMGLAVECGSREGVSFKLKVTRLGQRLSIPILISDTVDFKLALMSFAFPIIGYITVDRLVIRQWRQKRKERKLEELRKENSVTLEQRRQEAESAVALLADTIARKLEAEESREGLVIISALYGKLPPSSLESVRVLTPQGIHELAQSIKAQFKFLKTSSLPVSHQQDYIDVTIPVQALVTNGQLHIPGGFAKSNLIGFYDPCFGEKKQLRVTYQFQGRMHQVTVNDRAALAAPLRAHFVCI
ncbi:hypothetical protein BC833DRAFT_573954 [Globomyces pollinis-pini]|nr:hypothetical protein BC833DRAFT_573954 [Globomyces pollinis-pini]